MAESRDRIEQIILPPSKEYDAFRSWLLHQPPEWSAVIAVRMALRIVPLISGATEIATSALTIFRAVASARFAAKYPHLVLSHSADAARITYAADAIRAAYVTTEARFADADIMDDALERDARQLLGRIATPSQLAASALWPNASPPTFELEWKKLASDLDERGEHWSVWIAWYENILADAMTTKAWDAAFTDLPSKLPRGGGPEAVNAEIARRLDILDRLPQEEGEGDAKDLSDLNHLGEELLALSSRQQNLIKGILDDLPSNAPKYVRDFLGTYHDELKNRGTQPILGLIKDSAQIITAAVSAPNARDEWLSTGMRKAFERFTFNHTVFVNHFPQEVERELLFAVKPLHENVGESLRITSQVARSAHQAGMVTDDFVKAVETAAEFEDPTPAVPRRKVAFYDIAPIAAYGSLSLLFFVGAIGLVFSGGTGFTLAFFFGSVASAMFAIGRMIELRAENLL